MQTPSTSEVPGPHIKVGVSVGFRVGLSVGRGVVGTSESDGTSVGPGEGTVVGAHVVYLFGSVSQQGVPRSFPVSVEGNEGRGWGLREWVVVMVLPAVVMVMIP